MTGFSLPQKLLMGGMQCGLVVVGAVALAQDSIWFAISYVAGIFLIFGFGALPHFCAHCPYPHKYGDCLIMPSSWITRLVSYRGPRVGVKGKLSLAALLLFTLLVPQPWLWGNWAALVLFWLLALGMGLVFRFSLCKKCRHLGCPANRASKASRKECQRELASYRAQVCD